MSQLPTGTVTFLFTDIEGSTGRWDAHPDAMRAALERHDALMRQAVEAHAGQVFKTVGDAFCAAFATAGAGLDLDLLGGVEEAADALDEPLELLRVDLVRAAEVVEDLVAGHARLGVADLVGQLEVADAGAVLADPRDLANVHVYEPIVA